MNSDRFPFPFCRTKWIEYKPVADRLLEIQLHVVKVVNYWVSLPKSKQTKCNSFKVVKRL